MPMTLEANKRNESPKHPNLWPVLSMYGLTNCF